jgi:hypothetical protein
MATLILTIRCEDEVDVNDMIYLLFGPYEEAARFGDELCKHEFTLERTDEDWTR